jgi:hypothetical protein
MWYVIINGYKNKTFSKSGMWYILRVIPFPKGMERTGRALGLFQEDL